MLYVNYISITLGRKGRVLTSLKTNKQANKQQNKMQEWDSKPVKPGRKLVQLFHCVGWKTQSQRGKTAEYINKGIQIRHSLSGFLYTLCGPVTLESLWEFKIFWFSQIPSPTTFNSMVWSGSKILHFKKIFK